MKILNEYLNKLTDSDDKKETDIPVGKHNHVPDEKFNAKELKMGIVVEKEHTDCPIMAKAIAKDHLAECANYYTRLAKMEKDCENK